MNNPDYNEWTTEELESLSEEILPILKERYKKEHGMLRKEMDEVIAEAKKENDNG